MSRALTTLLMLALHGAAWAGPVPAAGAEADTPQSVAPRVLGDVTAADSAASAPSDSALAVEIIKEAEAGAGATDAPRSPRRDSAPGAAPAPTQAAVARNPTRADDDPWGVREASKAALQWVKDAVPWLRGDDDARDAGQNVALNAADWSASALEGGQAGRSARFAGSTAPNVAAADPTHAVGYGDTPRPRAAAPEENVVRVLINAIREVLEHPMTWLVGALVVIGGIAVKKLDRRPTK